MKNILDYLMMFTSWGVFWIASILMLLALIVSCVAVPAAIGLGFYELFKMLSN